MNVFITALWITSPVILVALVWSLGHIWLNHVEEQQVRVRAQENRRKSLDWRH